MRYFLILLVLLAVQANGSNTPLSGTFSNASANGLDGTFNLIVTATDKGQQFFVQCFKNQKVEFGTVTNLAKPKIEATIKAGANCPNKLMRVRLDYEEAYIKVTHRWIHLPRGEIYVPIVD